MYAPKGGLERHTSQALSELEQLTARKSLQQSKWISYFEQKGAGNMLTRIRNAIINVNTALAGVGAMFEFFNWVEADYKSDEVGKTAALLSMGGGLAIDGAIGALGVLAGSSTLSAGTLTLLTGLSYATLGIGIVLITIAIIYNQFAPEDIELWAAHGFWGNSLNYWGEPDKKKLMSGQEKDRHHLKQEYLKPVNLVIPKVNLRSPMKFVTTKYFSLEYTS
ncbi:hypothetical protein [Aggregatibacter actinomycetemcomitans]|uniref:hypothetical protein n=1 Tax=Aggregatibacter actinomycetemcomitans TaxID=714 RepID=UPI00211EB2C4|nr:hypothetical protein [Aggregatibacter actinomycetemcomitans]